MDSIRYLAYPRPTLSQLLHADRVAWPTLPPFRRPTRYAPLAPPVPYLAPRGEGGGGGRVCDPTDLADIKTVLRFWDVGNYFCDDDLQ